MPQNSGKKSKKSKKKSGRVSSVPLPGGAGPSRSDEPPTPSVPNNSTLKSHGSQPPTRQPRSENNVVESSPLAALSTPNRNPFRKWSENNVVESSPLAALSTPNRNPFRKWSENNVVESSPLAALSTPNRNPFRQPPHRPVPAPQPGHDQGVSRSPGSTTSFLTGASGFQMGDINHNYYEAPREGSGVRDNSIDGWELLLKNTAPNALYNSRARYDAPKCDEDTRVEVLKEIMDQIQDRDGPHHLLCMTGAAGSGKSALQQTTALKCGNSGILAASIFLSAGDPTRNTVDPVIPTIVYQLGRNNETVKRSIKATIKNDPLIFHQSLEDQATALIVEPFERMRDTGADLWRLPYVILIDGLDECEGEDRQAELLEAIGRCLLADDLPFFIFIASRPEWAIRTALEPGGHLREKAYHIQLSDKYDASADMRRYLQRRFEAIGLRINDSEWFSKRDIKTLVTAGSGQFAYVAMVYNYILERRASPAERLKIVLAWTPREGQATQPFEALDRLYTNILLVAKDAYEAVDSHHGRDFLLLFRAYQLYATAPDIMFGVTQANFGAEILSVLLRLEARAEEILLSDVRSLLTLEKHGIGGSYLRLYHKSLSDFFEQPGRAKDLFVPDSRVDTHLAKCLMQHIIEYFDSPTNRDSKELHSPVKVAILYLPEFLNQAHAIDDEVVEFTEKGGWQKIDDVLLRVVPLYRADFDIWIRSLRRFTSAFKNRKPETAAAMSVFVEEWENEARQRDEARPADAVGMMQSLQLMSLCGARLTTVVVPPQMEGVLLE